MASKTKQSRKSNESSNDGEVNYGSFAISVNRCWGTTLEKKLAQLRYPELAEAFVKAATVIEVCCEVEEVRRYVRLAKPKKVVQDSLSESFAQDSVYARKFRRDSGIKLTQNDAEVHGPALAMVVMSRLWVLAELLGPTAKRISTAKIVTAVTEVCLLAEQAKQVYYAEERTRQWARLCRAGRILPPSSTQKLSPERRFDVFDTAIKTAFRWLKQNGPRFTNFTDAASAYVDSNLHPIPPFVLYWILHHCSIPTIEA